MDEGNAILSLPMGTRDFTVANRDENRSPTSGSSGENFADEYPCRRAGRNRKDGRHPKRKRKWKPYSELSWDEKRVQDDRESRRAFAKRERLSAEGHPIAPYNTTQFLMDDRKVTSPSVDIGTTTTIIGVGSTTTTSTNSNVAPSSDNSHGVELEQQHHDEAGCNNRNADDDDELLAIRSSGSPTKANSYYGGSLYTTALLGRRLVEQSRPRYFADSPITVSITSYGEKGSAGVHGDVGEEDIQRFIMDDFSHTYNEYHAEELQSKSKAELIEDCLRLESKVDVLEKRVKECRRRHKEDSRGQSRTDRANLLEKINQLQVLNAQLLKDNASITQPPSDNNLVSRHDAGA